MQSSMVLSVGLPAALCIIMLGLGLSLRLDDFRRVLSRPKPVIIGLISQAFIMPAICFVLVLLAGLPPAIGVGMMLLAASPGGSSASLYTHLAHGDVALSIALTAITSLFAMVSLPIVANVSLRVLFGEAATVYLEVSKILQIFAIAIVPALIGAFIHSRYPDTARRLDRPVKLLATLFLAAVVVFAIIGQWGLVSVWGPTVGVAALAFNLISLGVGYGLPRVLGVERDQAIALGMAVAIHNAALVIAMAMSGYMLNNSEMAIAPAIYGLIAYITAGLFAWMLNRNRRA